MRVTGCAKQSAPFRGNAVSLDDWADKNFRTDMLYVSIGTENKPFGIYYVLYNRRGRQVACAFLNIKFWHRTYYIDPEYAWLLKSNWIRTQNPWGIACRGAGNVILLSNPYKDITKEVERKRL